MADDIPPGDIDFSQGVRGKYAKPLPAGMHQ